MRAFYMETSAHEVGWTILYPLYTSVTQQEEYPSDTRVVVGSTPTTSTIICGVTPRGVVTAC